MTRKGAVYPILVLSVFCAAICVAQAPEDTPPVLRDAVEKAVARIRPALVRIHVVETYYSEGREMKYESSGSGVVITPEGHVITNHHVAGHAHQLKCTFFDKTELDAELVGTDPLTDIAVIKLQPEEEHIFATAAFGNSDAAEVGDHVLAMGSPLALSQSVTLGIISNTEMTMPAWMSRRGGLEQDGEDVGSLVRWIGHDADIYGGNSGGALVDMDGKVIGINEIKMGLGGAIPANLAREVSEALMNEGKVVRAWLGIGVQPRLRHDSRDRGVLVGGVLKGGPAEKAGIQSGDLLVSVNGQPVNVKFDVQMPDFNRMAAKLPIGKTVGAVIERDGVEQELSITPEEREPYQRDQYELKDWGITVRDLSFFLAREMKRDNTDGVLVTSVRPGGPSGTARPDIQENDVIVSVDGEKIASVADLRRVTRELQKDAEEPVPALTGFDRKTGQFVTVVEAGISELNDPGLEVKKAWLPVETQVITRNIAEALEKPELTGFRITRVYTGSTAEKAGLQTGDLILAVDGEKMTASAPEHYEELEAWIRQYRTGTKAELKILRGGEEKMLPVELVRAPKLDREMKKYRDDNFEFTVRDITFFDKAAEEWAEGQKGVLVDNVKPGSWAALGNLSVQDLILAVDGQAVEDVSAMAKVMEAVAAAEPEQVVFKVLRGIHTFYIELEPRWDSG
jgi:serine protease Do